MLSEGLVDDQEEDIEVRVGLDRPPVIDLIFFLSTGVGSVEVVSPVSI